MSKARSVFLGAEHDRLVINNIAVKERVAHFWIIDLIVIFK